MTTLNAAAMPRFADQLRAMRVSRRVTLDAVGAMAGVERSAVSKWERTGNGPLSSLEAYERALGVTIDLVLRGEADLPHLDESTLSTRQKQLLRLVMDRLPSIDDRQARKLHNMIVLELEDPDTDE